MLHHQTGVTDEDISQRTKQVPCYWYIASNEGKKRILNKRTVSKRTFTQMNDDEPYLLIKKGQTVGMPGE